MIAFDVGANNGSDSLRLSHQGYFVHSFEPVREMCDSIRHVMQGRGCVINEVAVSNRTGTQKFNVDMESDWGCSSFSTFVDGLDKTWPGRTDFKVSEVREIKTIRLDDYCRTNNITRIDYIHIDAQGHDLKVLESLGDMLEIVKAGVAEAATDEKGKLYTDSPTIGDFVRFFFRRPFRVMEIRPNDDHCNEVNIYFSKIA